MRNKIYIFTTLYFLLVCFIFWNPALGEPFREGNRIYECGPGVYMFKDNMFISSSNIHQPFSLTTYTLASASGTSECTGSTTMNNDQRVNYIVTNFYEIQEDVAKGGGLYLDGLSTIMGCERTNFKIILRDEYENIFKKENSEGIQIYNELRYKIKNSKLKNHCIDYS